MERKKLKELNLLDNFLFWTMVSYPGIGEEFVRRILETVFGRKFGELTIVPEKGYPGSDTDLHGARLDVYVEGLVEEDPVGGPEESLEPEKLRKDSGNTVTGRAVIYDLEPDNNSNKKSMLPRRVRFYHSKIDALSLQSGKDYNELKDVYVVMILPYDPFGRDQMVYTVKNQCREDPELTYEDGAATVFLYTKGTRGEASETLKQLLKYFEETTEKNAVNENLKEIHRMVKRVKEDREVTMKYLRIQEHERDLVEQGVRQGISQGIRQGRQEERNNTEREKMRADAAEKELRELRKELELLRTNL